MLNEVNEFINQRVSFKFRRFIHEILPGNAAT